MMNEKRKELVRKKLSLMIFDAEIDEKMTFSDLFRMLVEKRNVYNHLNDSLVRERCFAHVIEVTGMDLNFLYDLWLHGMRCLNWRGD